MKKIVICGPESTGKTTLARDLASHFHCSWVTEYAREYVSKLKRSYNYDDLKRIALKQMLQDAEYSPEDPGTYVFFDTHLIITQVWFEEVYEKAPSWLINYVKKCSIDYFLLCAPDLEWKPDGVRENPGARREELFLRYQVLIKSYGYPFSVIRGKGSERIKNALKALNEKLAGPKTGS